MGNINLQDSGYIKSSNAGTQASSGNRANSGTAISLKTVEFLPSLKRNISNTPDLASNEPSETNLGSLENMNFKLRCVLRKDSSADMNLIPALLDMVRTNGYKLLWYDYTSATVEKNNGQLIFQIASNGLFGDALTNGEKTAFSISSNFVTLHVLFSNITPADQARPGTIKYVLTGKIIKVEASVI